MRCLHCGEPADGWCCSDECAMAVADSLAPGPTGHVEWMGRTSWLDSGYEEDDHA